VTRAAPAERRGGATLATWPNALCLVRLVGVAPLLWVAWRGWAGWYVGLVAAMVLTDWFDGWLARRLDQRSRFGARLDSLADAVLYATLLPALWWLRPEVIREQWPWMAAAGAAYTAGLAAAWVRFRVLPIYHTRAAKIGAWLVTACAAVVLLGGPAWLVWVGCGWMLVTNVEMIAISLVLPHARRDVPSLWHAVRHRQRDPDAARR